MTLAMIKRMSFSSSCSKSAFKNRRFPYLEGTFLFMSVIVMRAETMNLKNSKGRLDFGMEL